LKGRKAKYGTVIVDIITAVVTLDYDTNKILLIIVDFEKVQS